MKADPRVALAAFVLGLAACPWAFVFMGALGDFAPAFARLAVPLLLLSQGVLVWRLVGPPARVAGGLSTLLELLAWGLVLAFMVIVSAANLHRGLERVGLFSMLWLACSVLACPVAWLRPRSLLALRLQRLPDRAAWFGLLLLLTSTGLLLALYVLRPAAFPH